VRIALFILLLLQAALIIAQQPGSPVGLWRDHLPYTSAIDVAAQAVRNGKDYKGRKIYTGVYLVLVSNDERTEKTAAKIIFINK
jgi:hypothetical protein